MARWYLTLVSYWIFRSMSFSSTSRTLIAHVSGGCSCCTFNHPFISITLTTTAIRSRTLFVSSQHLTNNSCKFQKSASRWCLQRCLVLSPLSTSHSMASAKRMGKPRLTLLPFASFASGWPPNELCKAAPFFAEKQCSSWVRCDFKGEITANHFRPTIL